MSEYTFQGYRRANGKVGARNLVAVIPSVICANDVGQAICRQVQGTIGYFHHQGCCQLPIDLKRVTDTLSNLGQSPNVGAALIISLGCEGTDHERMVEEIRAAGKPVEIIRIQELGGTSRAIQAGIDAAQRLVQEISGLQRETVDISEVVMSIKCGVAGVCGQRAVGAGQVWQTRSICAVKNHSVGRHHQIILGHIVLDQLCAVKHGKAIAQITQGVVHAGQCVSSA